MHPIHVALNALQSAVVESELVRASFMANFSRASGDRSSCEMSPSSRRSLTISRSSRSAISLNERPSWPISSSRPSPRERLRFPCPNSAMLVATLRIGEITPAAAIQHRIPVAPITRK